jgi:hypothetical protein
MRLLLWLCLVKAGFRLRSFLSQDAKSIFTVLYASDENLRIMAEEEKLNKALKFEFCDLFSLDPVDTTLRPIRLNAKLWQQREDEEEEGAEEEEANNKVGGQ